MSRGLLPTFSARVICSPVRDRRHSALSDSVSVVHSQELAVPLGTSGEHLRLAPLQVDKSFVRASTEGTKK
jgi:hypothetical protein